MTSNVRAYHLATTADYSESSIASMKKDGSWSDVNYSETPSGAWSVGNHYSRIYAMTLAYNIPTYFRYHQAALLTSITLALDYGQKHVAYNGCPLPGNWWWWEIGVPNNLGPSLLLMQGFVNATSFTASRDALAFLIKSTIQDTGQNRIWSAMNHMYLGLMDRDAARMTLVKQAIELECAVQSGVTEGIKEDGSFYQHGAQLYNGGYGRGFGEDVSRYLLFSKDSAYQVTTSSVETLANYILDGSRWMIYGNYYEISCRGREFTRGDQGQMTVPLSLLVLGNVANSRRTDAISAAKRFMQIKSGWSIMRVRNPGMNPTARRGSRRIIATTISPTPMPRSIGIAFREQASSARR
ncbi:MAG: hypothetical protein NTX50_05275 [Candidatus Sumerlaeota bacterium]|nr:hypothetical protein [Candidatus Sumerlaeota bacterium]